MALLLMVSKLVLFVAAFLTISEIVDKVTLSERERQSWM